MPTPLIQKKPGNGKGNKNGNPKKVQKQVQKKTSNYRGVVAAGGSTVKKAFGARGMRNGNKSSRGLLMCWNALNERHLSLPRAVGPYQVVRFTRVFSTMSNMVIIGAFGEQTPASKRPEISYNHFVDVPVMKDGTQQNWSSICAIACHPEDIHQTIAGKKGWNGNILDANGNFETDRACRWKVFNMPGVSNLRDSAQICPSAITVQVMNPSPMQKAHGQVFGAVMNTQLTRAHNGGHQTPVELGNHMIAFQKPRLLVGARLALRQAQASSYPLDMTDVADFRNISDQSVGGIYHSSTTSPTNEGQVNNGGYRYWGSPHMVNNNGTTNLAFDQVNDLNSILFNSITNIDPNGWAPIVIYRQPEAGQEAVVNTTKQAVDAHFQNGEDRPDSLTYAVTIEYRVRFEAENPAVASHKVWPLATDKQWHQAISAARSLNSGFQDGFSTESKGIM